MKRKVAVLLALVFGLFATAFAGYLVLAPTGYRPTKATVQAAIPVRAGFEVRSGRFEGLTLGVSGSPAEVILDGRALPVTDGFQIRRALLRRSTYAIAPRLQFLELPDWEGWSEYRGSDALYEAAVSTGDVSRVIIIEEPR